MDIFPELFKIVKCRNVFVFLFLTISTHFLDQLLLIITQTLIFTDWLKRNTCWSGFFPTIRIWPSCVTQDGPNHCKFTSQLWLFRHEYSWKQRIVSTSSVGKRSFFYRVWIDLAIAFGSSSSLYKCTMGGICVGLLAWLPPGFSVDALFLG